MRLSDVSRRRFIAAAAGAAAAIPAAPAAGDAAAAPPSWQVAVFSKIHHNELGMSYEETAEVTAATGFDGIDCPVRPGGQVAPERVADDLPRLLEILKRRGLRLPKLTTHIVGADSPHAEKVLRTAAGLGIRLYRLGPIRIDPKKSPYDQIAEIRAPMKDLAALNREIGVCGLLQNHSGPYVGDEIWQNHEIVRGFDPKELALAWDIGHATAVLGEGWHAVLQLTRSHFGVAYVKDYDRATKRWVPLGTGSVDRRYFSAIKAFGYRGLVSVHFEFEVGGATAQERRANLIAAMRADQEKLRRWLAEA